MSTQTATKTTTRPNKFAGCCSGCGAHVPAAGGSLGPKVGGRWTVTCTGCVGSTSGARRSTRTSTARRATSTATCEACGRRGAHQAIDMSGIPGMACWTCDDGSLSLA